ncbi:MAG: hypothetical protein Q9169_006011 [Polycauliona sp. 2 TL-2023]
MSDNTVTQVPPKLRSQQAKFLRQARRINAEQAAGRAERSAVLARIVSANGKAEASNGQQIKPTQESNNDRDNVKPTPKGRDPNAEKVNGNAATGPARMGAFSWAMGLVREQAPRDEAPRERRG